MINPSWKPSDLKTVDQKWVHVKLPSNENINAAQAERLMIDYLQVREDWLDQYVNASYYEDVCEFKYEATYQIAFMKAGLEVEGKAPSDRTKDLTAKNDPSVRMAKMNLMDAKAATLETKLKLEGATLAHHAAKKILDEVNKEKWL